MTWASQWESAWDAGTVLNSYPRRRWASSGLNSKELFDFFSFGRGCSQVGEAVPYEQRVPCSNRPVPRKIGVLYSLALVCVESLSPPNRNYGRKGNMSSPLLIELLRVTLERRCELIDTHKYTVNSGCDNAAMKAWDDHYAGMEREWDQTCANHGLGTRQEICMRELIMFY